MIRRFFYKAGVAQRAVELLPMEKDSIVGIAMVKYLAMIAAWVGDKDLSLARAELPMAN
ncbi:MAG TPA: hypothetical protein VGG93_01305 [Candidatus Udaeobacter sp.]|jgi:hypothetical protein